MYEQLRMLRGLGCESSEDIREVTIQLQGC